MLELSPNSVIFGGPAGGAGMASGSAAVNPAASSAHPLSDPANLARQLRVKGMQVLEVQAHPTLRPFFGWPRSLKKIQNWVLSRALVWVQKQQKLFRPIVWVYDPVELIHIQALRPTRLILHVATEKSFEAHRDAWLELAQYAHVILSPRQAVLDRFSSHANRLLLEPPLDLDFFGQARGLKGDEPAVLKEVPYPRVAVWSGHEEYELDVNALIESARARADLHWVVIQTAATGNARIAALELEANIHVVTAAGAGASSGRGGTASAGSGASAASSAAATAPEILKFCNVIAVPVPDVPGIKKVNDNKIFEAMAAGKPVVTRLLPQTTEFQRFVYTYSTVPEMLIQVEQALKKGILHPDWCDELVQTRTLTAQLLRVLR